MNFIFWNIFFFFLNFKLSPEFISLSNSFLKKVSCVLYENKADLLGNGNPDILEILESFKNLFQGTTVKKNY